MRQEEKLRQAAIIEQAVKDFKSGDMRAFDILYTESKKYVYTVVYEVAKGNDNAMDIVDEVMQETYLEVFKSVGTLTNDESFLFWVGKLARRKCLAYIKKNRKYVLLSEEDTTFAELADDENKIPETIMQNREMQRLVRKIVDESLTEMQKLCIIAFYYDQMKQSEIAEELGIPLNTVKTNLSRAKAKVEAGLDELAKKQDTKLYSIAPVLFLLFHDEVQAAVVPQAITEHVRHSVLGAGAMGAGTATATASAGTSSAVGANAATGAGTSAAEAAASGAAKGFFDKLAAASIKTKIIAGLVGIGAVGAVGAAVGIALGGGNDEAPWESIYEGILLHDEEAEGFDLNDFDGDDIPELLVLKADGSMELYGYQEGSDMEKWSYPAVEENEEQNSGAHIRMTYEYGYDMECNTLLELRNIIVSKGASEVAALQPIYCNYATNKTEGASAYSLGDTDENGKISIIYFWEEDGQSGEMSEEETAYRLAEAQRRFNKIEYTDIKKKDMQKRFEEFKEYGNRPRVENKEVKLPKWTKENTEEAENTTGNTTETAETITEEAEKIVNAEISYEEEAACQTLAKYVTATKWGTEFKSGDSIEPSEQMVLDYIIRVSNDNFGDGTGAAPYDKYLPVKTTGGEWENMFTAEAIREFASAVFDVEIGDINYQWMMKEGELYAPVEFQYVLEDGCGIERVDIKGDTYYVYGTDTFAEWSELTMQPECKASYFFEMTLKKDSNSPLGFVFQKIVYEPTELAYQNVPLPEYQPEGESEVFYLEATFRSTRGDRLEFSSTGKVIVSEGPATHSILPYTMDAEGNIVIDPDGEDIPAKYYPDEDKVTIYGRNYERDR